MTIGGTLARLDGDRRLLSVTVEQTFDLCMIGSYNGSALCQGDIDSPSQTLIFFEILGSARALGASYPTHRLTRVDTRHNEGCNFAFGDGHVKWYRPRDTATENVNMWQP